MGPKKFCFAVIDDELGGTISGWKAICEILRERRFIQKTIKWPEDHDELAMAYVVFSSDSGEDCNTFDKAKRYLQEHQNRFDFYFIDIRMIKSPFRPQDPSYVEVVHEKIADGQKSLFIAGVEFINILDRNKKPKIFYSGATETDALLRYFELIKNRLDDVMLGKLDLGYLNKIEKVLDQYLRQRQVEIIERQSMKLRKLLKDRCDDPTSWDLDDIPDNGGLDQPGTLNERWSLRTLFPKQVNKLAIDEDPDDMKRYIRDILDRDWRQLMKEGFLNHPYKFGGRLNDAQETVRSLEFDVEAKANRYKRITDLSAFNDKNELAQLRDRILDAEVSGRQQREYQIAYQHSDSPQTEWKSIVEYFSSIYPKERWFDLWRNLSENFGLYPFDIAYISHIAFDNRRHLPNKPVPSFSLEKKEKRVDFLWFYDASPDNVLTNIIMVHEKFKKALEYPQRLQDEGYSDVCKIVYWRYRGTVEFRSDKFCVQATRNGHIPVKLFDNYEVFSGVQLRVSIQKP